MHKKYAFVILNYMSLDDTIACVTSIQNNYGDDAGIVIVDNASPDNSGITLKDKYLNNPNIIVHITDKNLGFAGGNNIGIELAWNLINPEFTIVCNSDVIFNQKDFLSEIDKVYEETNFDILGPDILNVTPSGEYTHISPLRKANYSIKDLEKELSRYRLEHLCLSSKTLYNAYTFLKDQKNKGKNTTSENPISNKRIYGALLQGSCYIFSKKFIYSRREVFCSRFFMYGEEIATNYLATLNKNIMLYSPSLQVVHQGNHSVNNSTNDKYDSRRFILKSNIDAYTLLINVFKGKETL